MNKVFFNIRKYNLKITCDANDFMQFDYSAFPEKSNFPEQEKKFHYLKASAHVCNFRRSSTQNMLRRFPALHWNCTFNPFSKFHLQHNLS